jgi:hypothetical protein
VFAIVNIAISVGLVYGWAKFMGYNRTKTPVRPRLVKESGGFIPVGSEAKQ